MTRRGFLKWLGGLALSGAALTGYAFAIEPGFRLRIQRYAFTPPRWTPGLKLKIVCLADPHLGEPYMPLSRWQNIIDTANRLEPDLFLLLGDYTASNRFVTKRIKVDTVARACTALSAPLGTYSINGNHDWWDDEKAQKRMKGPTLTEQAFTEAGIRMLVNDVTRLEKDGRPFWLSGTDSLVAVKTRRPGVFYGRDDIEGTVKKVTDDAPIIHMAHEPDLFINMPDRVSLTLSGHTHGGQVRLFGYSPIVPSSFGNRFAWGHIIEDGRHLVVSGGLGCSILPVRFGMPPEITLLELG
ncbi:MAG: metallophosphoesterase [Anderseniella sp.]|nr:metallophosphoesterase [Anderseniella sp.]